MTLPPPVQRSQAMQDTLRLARMFAHSPRPLLLRGPAGCGKRTLAARIHAWSANEVAVYLDCAARRPSAALDRLGEPGWLQRFGAVNLLLIGVDALPPQAQHALATALSEPAPCRVMATARQPGRVVGRLLDALPLQLEVPGLGQRRDDLLPLAGHMLEQLARPAQSARLSPSAQRYLTQHTWSQHLSELRLLLRCALDAEDLASRLRSCCPQCGRRYLVPRKHAGKLLCKPCSHRFPVLVPTELELDRNAFLAGYKDPRFLRAQAQQPREWLELVCPRAWRRVGRYPLAGRLSEAPPSRQSRSSSPPTGPGRPAPKELQIRVRERLRATLDAKVVLAGLPPHPALPALPPEPPRPLPPIPPRIEVVALELERYALDVIRRRLFPERRGWRRGVLAGARQLRFTREGWTALESATLTFVCTLALLLTLCFGLGEQAPRRTPRGEGSQWLRSVQSWIRPLGQTEIPTAYAFSALLVFSAVFSSCKTRRELEALAAQPRSASAKRSAAPGCPRKSSGSSSSSSMSKNAPPTTTPSTRA